MSRKTKSEKIASQLRALRSESNVRGDNHREDESTVSLSSVDISKTFVTTLFTLSCLALVYVLQLKGYIR